MRHLKLILLFLVLGFCYSKIFIQPVFAIIDPLTTANNRFGIHTISSTSDEASEAADLVNSSGGDWGYITILIESKNRDHNKWQTFFNDLRRKHLIPIVRLATTPEKNYWKRPYEGEEEAWADFLNSLNWPINEPNQGQEWGEQAVPKSYARVLDKTITALKNKSPDFFILNAGFDASAPNKPPSYYDEKLFLTEMEEEVPGVLNRLDGWSSHSYPNPGFVGFPNASGKGSVLTWVWEQQVLKSLGVTKDLPVFITETGWKHAEGLDFDKSLPMADKVADYYTEAFTNAWNDRRITAVTPFLLNYQESPFDHFSFKKLTGEKQNTKILGVTSDNKIIFPAFYAPYQALLKLPKTRGKPIQDNKAELQDGGIYSSLVSGENYNIFLTFKNTGQSIWNDNNSIELRALKGGTELQIKSTMLNPEQAVEPGQTAIFNLKLKAPKDGSYVLSLQLFNKDQEFDQSPLVFSISIQSPVELLIKTSLKWKKDFNGDYILTVSSNDISNSSNLQLNRNGQLDKIEARYLLPDYTFDFTLHKKFYKPKTVNARVHSGENILDFGELEPEILSVLFNPQDLWKLLPFSN